MAIKNSDIKKKYSYFGEEVFYSRGQWHIVRGGEWFDFNDWARAEELPAGKSAAEKKSWWFKITRKRWVNDWGALNPIQRATLQTLWLYAGNKDSCYPSKRTLARDLNISERTIDKTIKDLEKLKCLKIERCKNRVGIFNKYWLKK
jgi:hypothetical protein